MQLSIIILTWNSKNYITNCISSLITNIDQNVYPYEIFIVDNGSTDGTKEIIEGLFLEYPKIINLISLEKNYGTTYPRNLALKKATGDFIAIVDSDITAHPGFLDPLVSVLNRHPDAGIVVPQLIYGNGRSQISTDNFPTIFTKIKRYFFLKELEKLKSKNDPHHLHSVDYAISAFWLLKRAVYDKVGNFDENIFYAPEDVDYCLRVWKTGYKILYQPSCVIIHDAQEITRGFNLNRMAFEHLKGLLYYFFKHKYILKKPYFKQFKP